ncbi:MAG: cation transporter [Thermoplasmatales archaeon]|nr:MAG: cation transporter [Thermoplasmatales archaeon]
MGESKQFVEKADRLAGITTIALVVPGIIQIILGETISKSVALTANGIDCIGDGFVSAVVWLGLLFFKKPADEKFHYGYYKMENLASSVAAVVMIGLAIYIGFRSYNQLINPHPVNLPFVGAAVALISAVIALSLGFYKYSRGKNSKMNSIKLEAFNTIKDGGASGLAIVALILSSQGFIIADAVAGFIIAGIIATIGFAAIKESSYMLVDACDVECIDKSYLFKKIAQKVDGVEKANVVRLRRSGPILQGEMEIQVSDNLTINEFNKIKREIKKKIKEQLSDIERLTITAMEN